MKSESDVWYTLYSVRTLHGSALFLAVGQLNTWLSFIEWFHTFFNKPLFSNIELTVFLNFGISYEWSALNLSFWSLEI